MPRTDGEGVRPRHGAKTDQVIKGVGNVRDGSAVTRHNAIENCKARSGTLLSIAISGRGGAGSTPTLIEVAAEGPNTRMGQFLRTAGAVDPGRRYGCV